MSVVFFALFTIYLSYIIKIYSTKRKIKLVNNLPQQIWSNNPGAFLPVK